MLESVYNMLDRNTSFKEKLFKKRRNKFLWKIKETSFEKAFGKKILETLLEKRELLERFLQKEKTFIKRVLLYDFLIIYIFHSN